MANKNTKRKNKQLRKWGTYFHGKTCDTTFGAKGNKHKRPHSYPKIETIGV